MEEDVLHNESHNESHDGPDDANDGGYYGGPDNADDGGYYDYGFSPLWPISGTCLLSTELSIGLLFEDERFSDLYYSPDDE